MAAQIVADNLVDRFPADFTKQGNPDLSPDTEMYMSTDKLYILYIHQFGAGWTVVELGWTLTWNTEPHQ
jgi:hypothetical protein